MECILVAHIRQRTATVIESVLNARFVLNELSPATLRDNERTECVSVKF